MLTVWFWTLCISNHVQNWLISIWKNFQSIKRYTELSLSVLHRPSQISKKQFISPSIEREPSLMDRGSFEKNPTFHEYLSRYQPFPLKPALETAPGPNILFPVDLPRPPTQPWPALLTPSRLKASRRVLRPWCMVAVYLHADGLRPFFSFFLRALAALGKPRLFTGSRTGAHPVAFIYSG